MPDTPCGPWTGEGSTAPSSAPAASQPALPAGQSPLTPLEGGPRAQATSGSLQPAGGQPAVNQAAQRPTDDRSRIESRLSQVEAKLKECCTGCQASLNKALAACGDRLSECQSVIRGELSRRLLRVEDGLGLVKRKMDERLTSAVRQLYLLNMRLGLPVPSDQEVAAELVAPPSFAELMDRINQAMAPDEAPEAVELDLGEAPPPGPAPLEPAGPKPPLAAVAGEGQAGLPGDFPKLEGQNGQPRPQAGGGPGQPAPAEGKLPEGVEMPPPFRADRQLPGQQPQMLRQLPRQQPKPGQQPQFQGARAERPGDLPNWCNKDIAARIQIALGRIAGDGIDKALKDASKEFPFPVNKIGEFMASLIVGAVKQVPAPENCDAAQLGTLAVLRGLLGFLEKWFGIDFWAAGQSLDNSIRFACPQIVPTTDRAVELYLGDQATEAEGRFWTKTNGECDWQFSRLARIRRTKPNVADAVALRLREHFDEAALSQALRDNGVTEDKDKRAFLELAKYIPTPDELVRFMVRDVFDEAIVDRFKLDTDFSDKFTGKAKDWARAQGMTEEQFKFNWRAHWRLPSPTQAFEMLHRNRKGRVPDDQIVERRDVQRLLEVDDLAPFWVERLIAVSYSPLTRLDAKRAYYVGALTREELHDAFLDLGYTPTAAGKLVAFSDVEKTRWVANQLGLPTPRTLATDFADLVIDRGELEAGLRVFGFDQEAIATATRAAAAKTLRRQKRQARGAVRKRYMMGLLNDAAAAALLMRRGFGNQQSVRMVAEWQLDREMKGKLLTAPVLCRLANRGLVNQADYLAGLVRLGYSEADARSLAGMCFGDEAKKQFKEREKAVQKALAERAKQMKAAKAAGEKAAKETVAQRKAREAALRKADRDAERLCKQQAVLAQRLGEPPPIYVDGECFIPPEEVQDDGEGNL